MIITSKNSEGHDDVENMLREIIKGGTQFERNNVQTDSGDENSYGSLRDLRNKRLSDSRESPQFGCQSTQREGYQVSFKNDSAGVGSNEELENALCQNNARIYQVIGGNSQYKPFQKQSALYTLNGSEHSSIISENSPQTSNLVAREVNESSKPSPQFLNPVKIYQNQGTRHLSLSSSTGPFKNNLPQYAEMVKWQNNQLLPSESPQLNPIKNSHFEDQCPQYMKRKSAFVEKSHLSISSIFTGNSGQKKEEPIDATPVLSKIKNILEAKSQIVDGGKVSILHEKNAENYEESIRQGDIKTNNKISSNSIRLKNSSGSIMYKSLGSNAFNGN